jgi:uncharacterized protein (TIGR02996 family)
MWPDCASDPTGLALLQGAKEHPHDTDRRLILADWLEDQGELEVANTLRKSLQKREEWVPFPESVAARWRPWNGCVRGWLGVQKAVADLPDSPWLCALDLAATWLDFQGVQDLVALPHLAQLTDLNLSHNDIGAAGVKALVNSPHLRQLTTLNLGDNAIGDAGLQALADSTALPQLTTLYLGFNDCSSTGRTAVQRLRARGVFVTF